MTIATDLADCSALTLLALYRAGAASPVEATRAVLGAHRAASTRSSTRSATSPPTKRSRRRARAKRAGSAGAPCGELDGVPVSIKDLILAAGWPTLRGSRTVDPARPWDVDAPATARLREAGAVILGKTTTPEFGCKGETNSPLTGITRNPWNPAQDAGRLVGRHGGGGRRRHGAARGRHRRRRQRPHPGGVLRQLRPEAELRPRPGVSALADRHGRPPRPAHA